MFAIDVLCRLSYDDAFRAATVDELTHAAALLEGPPPCNAHQRAEVAKAMRQLRAFAVRLCSHVKVRRGQCVACGARP